MPITLSQLHIYPIKSTAGIALNRSSVSELGLSFDRRFVLCDSKGKFITARTQPRLVLIRAALTREGLHLSAPDMPDLYIHHKDFSEDYQPVTIWGDLVSAQHCHSAYDRWFSEYLGKDCRLLHFAESSRRSTTLFNDKPVAFADGYPLLLISQASMADLNNRCESTIGVANMRPNIVVNNTAAYAEDSWKRIRIGKVEFAVVKPCGRCIFTTVDPQTGVRNSLKEPLSILKDYRKGSDGEAHFGQNLIPLNSGIIELGEPVEVLETQAPENYLRHSETTIL